MRSDPDSPRRLRWLFLLLAGALFASPALCAEDQTSAQAPAAHPPASAAPPATLPANPAIAPASTSAPSTADAGTPLYAWSRLTGDWFTYRTQLEDRGITFQANLTENYTKNLMGGLDTEGRALRNLFNANFTIDTDKLARWPGGTFFVNFQNQAGRNAQELVGNYQGVSNIDADGRTALYELWYEQILFDKKLRIKVGKVDATNEFAHACNACEFLNSSMGYSPTLLGFPTFPDPATSINIFLSPVEWLTLGGGVYDGSTLHGMHTGTRGPASFADRSSDLFFIGEADFTWSFSDQLPGRFGLGLWHHNGTFTRWDGTTQSGATGPYAILDQFLWRENPTQKDDTQGLSMYAQYGSANPDIALAQQHLGIGLIYTGLIPSRDNDLLGLALTTVRLTDDLAAGLQHNRETVIELFYKLQLTPWLSLKPDFQYIHGPAFAERDAFAAGIQFVISF